LTPNWQIGAGYTYAAARVKKDGDPSRIGVRLDTHLPTRQFKLSTSYRLPDGQWRVGGNMRWQNTIHHDDDWVGHPYHTRQRAYAVVDAMAGYRYDKHLDIQLNITNLFDKVYYQEMSRQPMEWGGNPLYGEPRRFMLTARYQF
jgi:outer membrane receptor for ferric coprogen and ferric-rhodotorulic acid